jgi:hypothetical protein
MSPYRSLDQTIKWNYPEEIFQALDYVDPAADSLRGDKLHVRALDSWRWSSRLAGKKYPIDQLATLHLKTYFQSLRKLSFVNYQIPVLKGEEEDPKHELALATAIKALPKLEHLIFESSTLFNATLMPLLPIGLRQLELVNCAEVISDDLAAFLLTHGRKLQVLVLNHNKALDLKFLSVLGEACPDLKVLRMNLTFYNVHYTYRDSEPLFENLLLPDQIPVWPTTLQVIELIQLRNWSTEAAEMFFDSLLDSAGGLPDLRKLTIQAILNIAWRDRAAFRDKWVGSLQHVFKRVSAAPQSILSLPGSLSMKALIDNDKEESEEEAPKPDSARHTESQPSSSASMHHALPQRSREKRPASPPARRSIRSTTRKSAAGKYTESASSSDIEEAEPAPPSDFEEPEVENRAVPKISARAQARATRLTRELEILKQTAGFDSPAESTPLSASDSSDNDAPSPKKKDDKGKGKQFIQGMCDIVEIRIDNLRPTEKQVTEADFLDEERSGDEDWDGNDDTLDLY